MPTIPTIGLPRIPSADPLAPAKQVGDLAKKDEHVQLSEVLRRNGWSGAEGGIRKATAVALAESGGNPRARNWCCTGIMQVHYVHAGKLGSPTNRSEFRKWLENPDNNAKLAWAIYQEQGWQAWEAETNGAYRKFLGKDKQLTNKGNLISDIDDAVDSVVGTVTDPLSAVGDVADALFQPSTYLRIGKGWLGGVLIIMGTAGLIFVVTKRLSDSPAGDVVKGVAGAVVTKKPPI